MLEPFDQLPTASDEQIRKAREELLQACAAERTPLEPGKLLVDKNPLSMNALPLIHRLFPDARIILALRHPCDVVFSCFASNFKLNDGMSSFLQLDTAAELYDLSFTYFEKARELFRAARAPDPLRECRRRTGSRQLRSLLDFLGLDWSDEVLDHQSTAREPRAGSRPPAIARSSSRSIASPPAAGPTTASISSRCFPVLEPWVAKFGYTL